MATRKRTKSPVAQQNAEETDLPITNLEGPGISWESLAAVIIDRALLDQRAKALTPKEAARLRASGEAAQLARRESELWGRLCAFYAEHLLLAPIKGTPELRLELTTIRLRNILTSMSTAILDEARKGFRPMRSPRTRA